MGIWYILRAQRGSHIPTLRPKYIPYTYMDPLGKRFFVLEPATQRSSEEAPASCRRLVPEISAAPVLEAPCPDRSPGKSDAVLFPSTVCRIREARPHTSKSSPYLLIKPVTRLQELNGGRCCIGTLDFHQVGFHGTVNPENPESVTNTSLDLNSN